MPLTPSEQLTYDLCRRSFLSLWSYANPQQPNGKELADVMVVFGRHITVFSVKEIAFKEHGDPAVAAARWVRRAIDASIDQLRGARRVLDSMEHVIKSDGSLGIPLPPRSERVVHLMAVAAGGKREVPFGGGDHQGDYVHVVDEFALREIFSELDTAPDLIDYLVAKEAHEGVILSEGEENLFALYLHDGRSLPSVQGLAVQGGLWEHVKAEPEFKARKQADAVSYWWDEQIERLIADHGISTEAPPDPNEFELVVRTMASERRFERRLLSEAFIGWVLTKQRGGRMLFSDGTKTAHSFATFPPQTDRDTRRGELLAHCFVARSPRGPLAQAGCDVEKAIGLGTEVYNPSGYSIDVVYFERPTWTEEDDRWTEQGRSLFGIHQELAMGHATVLEFPRTTDVDADKKL